MTVRCHGGSLGQGRLGAGVVAGESGASRPVPDRVRELAGRLSALFERDVEIVERLNDAQRRLRGANERLWSDVFGLVDDDAAAAGESQIVALSAVWPGSQTELLEALQQIHRAIHRAFCQCQFACEERRQLAVEVGEVSQQLTEVLCAIGWSAADARTVDVHELARAGARMSVERKEVLAVLTNQDHDESDTG